MNSRIITLWLGIALVLPIFGCGRDRQAVKLPADYERQIEEFRRAKDQFLRESDQSPLTPSQKANFRGLIYFPVEPRYRFDRNLIPYAKPESVPMLTTQGMPQTYTRYGYIDFVVDGRPCRLTVYTTQINQQQHYFLPFKDATNGQETYAVGRYVEIEVDAKGKAILDFNLAYNPYCAYNHEYTCPIPPRENHLKAAIRAGEKNFVSDQRSALGAISHQPSALEKASERSFDAKRWLAEPAEN